MLIGIDLGTTNSAVSYIDEHGNPVIIPNREGERTTPSVIFFEDDTPIIGSSAKAMSVSDPFNTIQFVKRHMGSKSFNFKTGTGTTYTTEELSALVLKRLKKDAETYLGQTITKAVITVPAYFDDAQRQATLDAGEIAGLQVLRVINEPTAAALAYGLRQGTEEQNILVYDLGGGTFDVTILSISKDVIRVRATGGDRNLGGFDFDNKVINYVQEKFEEEHKIDLYDDEIALQELREKAEVCKKTLTNRKKALINITSQGKSLRVEITKEIFEEMISPLLNRTSLIMNTVLNDANLSWEEIDKVLLVGGSTRVPAVSDIIEKTTGKSPSLDVNPDEIVALGAAIQAMLLDQNSEVSPSDSANVIIDVNSHSLGTLTIDSDTEKFVNSIILPRNTELPASKSEVYYTCEDNQKSIHLQLTEGEDEDPEYVRVIGETLIQLEEHLPAESPLRITISYDENGIIHAYAHDETSKKQLGELKINRTANLSGDSVDEKTKKFLLIDVE
ncbi:Hsp70 family protein [Alkalihalobacillus sp. LMS39]|uniref:Hsp70 family protein n=1 Tax=Alkalihalobacillus sp. LMS39 TaxID=2924032 RepID=UPI001FB44F20|nr:Hsp70 family protein [Alkalihalobacillus sp. LMS39]UOE94784.1 Hsp70 family protein [Alkalihalobacillus sp. LMS39]